MRDNLCHALGRVVMAVVPDFLMVKYQQNYLKTQKKINSRHRKISQLTSNVEIIVIKFVDIALSQFEPIIQDHFFTKYRLFYTTTALQQPTPPIVFSSSNSDLAKYVSFNN